MKRQLLLPLSAAFVGIGLLFATVVWAAEFRSGPAPSGPAAEASSTTESPSDAPGSDDPHAADGDHAHTPGMDHQREAATPAAEHAAADDPKPATSPGMEHDHGDAGTTTGAEDPMAERSSHHGPKLAPLDQRQADATEEQRAAADAVAQDTAAAIEQYQNVDAAVAAGFRPNPTGNDRTIHYPNAANRRDAHQLDPSLPEGLMYEKQADGTLRLVAAVYTVKDGETAPMPGGAILQWHTHDATCGSFYVPEGECTDTFRMLHVWVGPGVVDPFNQVRSAALGR